jgi:hypothetical protein
MPAVDLRNESKTIIGDGRFPSALRIQATPTESGCVGFVTPDGSFLYIAKVGAKIAWCTKAQKTANSGGTTIVALPAKSLLDEREVGITTYGGREQNEVIVAALGFQTDETKALFIYPKPNGDLAIGSESQFLAGDAATLIAASPGASTPQDFRRPNVTSHISRGKNPVMVAAPVLRVGALILVHTDGINETYIYPNGTSDALVATGRSAWLAASVTLAAQPPVVAPTGPNP